MKNVLKTVAGIMVLTAGSISAEAAGYADSGNDELMQQRSQVREYAGKHGRFGYRNPDHVNRDKMKVIKVIKVGMGAGHTTFLSMRNQAIITNHNDTFVSVIDTEEHKLVRNVEVAEDASPDYKSQAHTSGVSLDMQYFYSAASHDGVFYRIDLDDWTVTKADAVLPGEILPNLLMGSFIWNGDGTM